MTRLDCNVEKCAYNADNCCKLREIDVKGTKAKKACDTQCGSFSNKACDCEVSAELAIAARPISGNRSFLPAFLR